MASYVPTLYWSPSSSACLGLGSYILPQGSLEAIACLTLCLCYVVQRECIPYLPSERPSHYILHFPSFVLVASITSFLMP